MRATALALLLALPAWATPPPRNLNARPVMGEGLRVAAAPGDLPPLPEVVEVSGGLVWLVKADGRENPQATRVPAGFFVTAAGFANLDASVSRETSALREEVARLREALAAPTVEVPAPTPGVLHVESSTSSGPRWWVVGLAIGGALAAGYGVAKLTR